MKRLLSLLAVGALTVAACGDDDDSAGGESTDAAAAATEAPDEGAADTAASADGAAAAGAGDAAADAAAATERVGPYLEPVTEIPVDVPLDAPPEEGNSLYWLEGNIQSILPITGGFEAAAEAIGWDLTTVTYDPADPQGPNAAMQQAVDAGADFIAISGQPISVFEQALAAAKAADIPVFAMFSEDDADPDAGLVSVVGGKPLTDDNAKALGDLIISDSGGEGDIVMVNIPDFAILAYAQDVVTSYVPENCANCSVDVLEVSIADLTAGGVPSQVASYLQSHPDTKYVYPAIGDLATGLPEALATAGIGRDVKIIGAVPNTDQMQSLIDDTSDAWITLPRVSMAWQTVDAMLRHDQGMDATVSEVVPPRPIFTPDNVPEPAADYAGVDGYEDQWKALWGVS